MRSPRLIPSMLIVGLGACAADPNHVPAGSSEVAPSEGGAAGDHVTTGTSGTGLDGSAGRDGFGQSPTSDGSAASMETEEGGDPTEPDAAAYDGPIIVVHEDSGPGDRLCTSDLAALGTRQLVAGGATPMAFARAYNDSVMTLSTPGPLLLMLSGVADVASTHGTMYLGALDDLGDQGVQFSGDYATAPFTFGAARALQMARAAVTFSLRFKSSAADTLVPVVAAEMTGTLEIGCSVLRVDRMKLLIPASAGSTAWGDSTLADLMGSPTEGDDAGSGAGWPLELSGNALEVYAPKPLVEGGAHP